MALDRVQVPARAQRLANAVRRDQGAATREATVEIASLGHHGDYKGNLARDFETYCDRMELCGGIEPYFVETEMRDAKQNIVADTHGIFLPHELAHALWETDNAAFRCTFGCDELTDYWQHAQNYPWFKRHPWKRHILRSPERCIPIRLHGDDAPCTKKTQIFVANMSPVCCRLQTWLSRLLLVCFPMGLAAGQQTYDAFFARIVWSILLMAPDLDDVVFPCLDYRRNPLSGKRLGRARQRICGGFRFVLTQFCGDWKFLKEFFQLIQTYSKDEFCFRCLGTKSPGLLCAWNCSMDAACFQVERSAMAFSRFLQSIGHPFAELTGFDLWMIMFDLMHICLLGCMQYLLGGVLWELCCESRWYRPPRGSWQFKTNYQLKAAFSDFKDWLRSKQLTSSHPGFNALGLSMHTLSDCPMLKVKAANCLLVCQWLSDVCCRDAAALPSGHHDQIRATTLWGFAQTFSILQSEQHWVSDDAVHRLRTTRAASCQGYNALSAFAEASKINRFPMKPKLHLFDHCCRDTFDFRENPTFCWVFADEDMIGKVKAIASRCHPFKMGVRTIKRWAMRYFAQLRNAKADL